MMTTESVAPKASESKQLRNGAAAEPVDIRATVARLRNTFASGRTRDIEWRTRQLLQLQKLMEENEEAISAALAADLDRNKFESLIADIATTAGEAKFAAKPVPKGPRRRHPRP